MLERAILDCMVENKFKRPAVEWVRKRYKYPPIGSFQWLCDSLDIDTNKTHEIIMEFSQNKSPFQKATSQSLTWIIKSMCDDLDYSDYCELNYKSSRTKS